MSIVYRLLGAVARLNERMSHTSVNLLPINWLAMVGLGVLFGVGVTQTREAVVNGATPRAAPLGEVLAHRNVERNFVTVVGPVLPEILRETSKSSGDVRRTWGIMVDPQGARAIFIEFKGSSGTGIEPQVMTITGMLAPLESRVRQKLDEMGGKIEDVPIDAEYVIQEGRSPGDAMTWGLTTALSGILLLLFVITFLRQYIIFQKAGARVASMAGTPPAVMPGQGVDLRVTGRFVLDEKNARRFLDVPAGMVTLETGEPAFVSNIDASSKFMGATTVERKGLWAIIVQRDSLRDPDVGTLYVGLATRPALRIRYVDAATSRRETAVLSCETESEREAVIAELNKAAGYGLVR
jgi:hypothetical protein